MAEPVNGDYERRISIIETKVDMFIDEMRAQNKMRADEMRALDAKILKLQESTDAKFAKIDEKFGKLEEKIDSMDNHVRNLAVAAMVGIGAMAAAILGIAYSVINKM